jgi:hypothetical protein
MVWGEQFGQGRCINCGFLCKRSIDSTKPGCYTATTENRTTGTLTDYIGVYKTIPCCFRNQFNIYSVLDTDSYTPIQSEKVFEFINESKNCQYWYPFTEFVSPNEHFEELKMMQLEQQRKEFEQQMEKERKEFDLKLFEMSKQIQLDSKSIVEKSDKFNRKITILVIILAVLEVIGTLLALFFPYGF